MSASHVSSTKHGIALFLQIFKGRVGAYSVLLELVVHHWPLVLLELPELIPVAAQIESFHRDKDEPF